MRGPVPYALLSIIRDFRARQRVERHVETRPGDKTWHKRAGRLFVAVRCARSEHRSYNSVVTFDKYREEVVGGGGGGAGCRAALVSSVCARSVGGVRETGPGAPPEFLNGRKDNFPRLGTGEVGKRRLFSIPRLLLYIKRERKREKRKRKKRCVKEQARRWKPVIIDARVGPKLINTRRKRADARRVSGGRFLARVAAEYAGMWVFNHRIWISCAVRWRGGERFLSLSAGPSALSTRRAQTNRTKRGATAAAAAAPAAPAAVVRSGQCHGERCCATGRACVRAPVCRPVLARGLRETRTGGGDDIKQSSLDARSHPAAEIPPYGPGRGDGRQHTSSVALLPQHLQCFLI